jgi:hypothetical protein
VGPSVAKRRYLARPPIANDRLAQLPDGGLALRFKQAWRDGTTHVVFTPYELIEKLIPLIPRPRTHLIRYHGILGPAAKDRAKVVPQPSLSQPKLRPEAGNPSHEMDATRMPRFGRTTWAVLLKRVFLVDALTCPKCDGRMKILAVITEPDSVREILDHLEIPSAAPPRHPARPPPQTEFPGGDADALYADPPSPES